MSLKKFKVILDTKISSFNKSIEVDSDKSLSIRGFLIGSICQNKSYLYNILESDDVKSSINACKKLGVRIVKIKPKSYLIYGKGLGSFQTKKNTLINFGNSGTLARLLVGILSVNPNIEIKMIGDHSLNKRSMKKLIILMEKFGATFYPKKKYNFPLKLISSNFPVGIEYSAGSSAQLKSATILAGLNSYGVTKITEKIKSRDHTENLLKFNKSAIAIKNKKSKTIIIYGKKYLNPIKLKIKGDPSGAAFFTALTLLNKNSKILIKNVILNPTRIGFFKLLKKNGANIKFSKIIKNGIEIFGDIEVKSSKLKRIIAPKNYYYNTTDEYPILFVIASLTKGTSIFKGISELKNKESDRITEMQKILRQVGVKSIFRKGELKIYGNGEISGIGKKIFVPNLGDHRICMSSFILAILTGAKATINNFETVNTSSPSFLKIMRFLGAKFEIQ